MGLFLAIKSPSYFLLVVERGAWMSQEVSKWLVNGL